MYDDIITMLNHVKTMPSAITKQVLGNIIQSIDTLII